MRRAQRARTRAPQLSTGEASRSPSMANRNPRPPMGARLGAFGLWRSLVARSVRVGEVAGSNPVSPIPARTANSGAQRRKPHHTAPRSHSFVAVRTVSPTQSRRTPAKCVGGSTHPNRYTPAQRWVHEHADTRATRRRSCCRQPTPPGWRRSRGTRSTAKSTAASCAPSTSDARSASTQLGQHPGVDATRRGGRGGGPTASLVGHRDAATVRAVGLGGRRISRPRSFAAKEDAGSLVAVEHARPRQYR